MKNNELLPFSRNRYYQGKMLTSTDFEAEQRYMNNKRRFFNQMVAGSGILCGLNVISLDDLSVMIESGAAIDDTGREIVVDSSVVKKLSALPGFEELSTDEVSLCIRYRESETQPVYAVSRQECGREFEYNRIEEGYELFLQDKILTDEEFEAETEFYTGGALFSHEDYQVCLKLPANICAGYYVRIAVEVVKCSEAPTQLFYQGMLHTPVLATPDGAHELEILLDHISLEMGQTLVQEYWLLAQADAYEDSSIIVKAGGAKAFVNGVEVPVTTGLHCKINIVSVLPKQLAARETSRVSMELRGMGVNTGIVRLADMKLVRTQEAYLIASVDESERKYVLTIGDACKRASYENCFVKPYPFFMGGNDGRLSAAETQGKRFPDKRLRAIATGTVEIPVGDNAKKGEIFYSGEIMHGLGAGAVYVEVGYESLEENEPLGKTVQTTIYGNPKLFAPKDAQGFVETAVKVLQDKGSFVVALKLHQNINMIILTYRWIAVRFDGEESADMLVQGSGQNIAAVTPTVVLGTKESYFFQVKYNHMKACSVSYELTEPASGEITADGIYTAPSKEGVYEIRIFCTDKPFICTYAYAIVKKKMLEEPATTTS